MFRIGGTGCSGMGVLEIRDSSAMQVHGGQGGQFFTKLLSRGPAPSFAGLFRCASHSSRDFPSPIETIEEHNLRSNLLSDASASSFDLFGQGRKPSRGRMSESLEAFVQLGRHAFPEPAVSIAVPLEL